MLAVDLQSLAYNIFFGFMFFVWIYRKKLRIAEHIRSGSMYHLWGFALLYVPVMTFLVVFVFNSDVNRAINSGIQGILGGVNVYDKATPVVEHFLRNGTQVMGVYHYFPPDLAFNTSFYLSLGWIDSLITNPDFAWFLATNTLLLGVLYPLVANIVQLPHKRLFPCFAVLSCNFLMTNSTIMVVLFVVGYWFMGRNSRKAGLGLYIISASIKYAPGLYLIIHFVEDLKTAIRTRQFSNFLHYLPGSLVLLVLMLPFGIFNVIESTLLYQGDVGLRSTLATIQGPLLVEILLHLNILSFYNIFFILGSVLSLGVSLRVGKNIYERQVYFAHFMMFLLPFMATELYVVPLFHWFITMMRGNEDSDPLPNLPNK